MRAPAWWQFLPPDADADGPQGAALPVAQGPAALSRALRQIRARSGAGRAASLLRTAEAVAGRRIGRSFTLLFISGQQPRSLTEALAAAFAIAGFAAEIRELEGLAALKDALDDRRSRLFDDLDLTLVCLPRRSASGVPAEPMAGLCPLCEAVAGRSQAPVAAVAAAEPAEGGPAPMPIVERRPGLFELVLLADAPLFDERFAASFGTIFTAEAADRLADLAAGLAARLKGTAPKLVVTDLDATLWDGILGEGDVPPRLHRHYALALAELAERGLILGVATRNHGGDVAAALAVLPDGALTAASFADVAAGWDDKPSLVADVLSRLGLAPEHTVFIDDDPVNCAKVAARFPAMDVRRFCADEADFAKALLADPLLCGNLEAGAGRSDAYRRRAAVERRRAEAPDIDAFLQGLDTVVTAMALTGPQIARAAELGGRVNQFILNGYRPNAIEIAARASPLDLAFRLDDVFGAHGIVGLIFASKEGDAVVIDNLMLSCRALERSVETAMLQALARLALDLDAGLLRLCARIETMERNTPARASLAALGFAAFDGGSTYDIAVSRVPSLPRGVTLRSAECRIGGR